MKKLILFSFITFLSQVVLAQVGFNVNYRFNDASNWVIVDELRPNSEIELLNNGVSLGIDYWFRLPNARIEFLPELSFNRSSTTVNSKRRLDLRFFNFAFNTNIYLFDLLNDCDCPTFSKDGGTINKGFFIQLSPGISLIQEEIKFSDDNYVSESLAFSIGGGIGFDLGISDLVTFSPIAGLRYYPTIQSSNLDVLTQGFPEQRIKDTESSILQLFMGFRVGLRFNYGRRY